MTLLIAVLADIHGNYQALLRVEDDARQVARAVKADELRFVSLGDVVDYGPQPNECMDWVSEQVSISVQGNHDREVSLSDHEPPLSLNRNWWPVTMWTRRELKEQFKHLITAWQPDLLGPQELDRFALFHSSLCNIDSYIKSTRAARENLLWLRKQDVFAGLFGHTHYQGYFIEETGGTRMVMATNSRSSSVTEQRFRTAKVGVWKPLSAPQQGILLNPGSVGQPRRHASLIAAGLPHDNDAAYMLLKFNGRGGGDFQFRRVSYDYLETIRLLRERVRWLPTDPPADGGTGASIDWRSRPSGGNSREDVEPTEISPFARDLRQLERDMPELLPQLVESDLIPKLLPDPDADQGTAPS